MLKNSFKIFPFLVLLAIAALIVSPGEVSANRICDNDINHLNGSMEMVQAKGGIWAFMERQTGLKEKSTMGLQIDAKLQRIVTEMVMMCEEGKTPKVEHMKAAFDLVGDARMITNITPGRPTPADSIQKIEKLYKALDGQMKKMGL